MEQLCGNILLELKLSNGAVDYLIMLATHYTGYENKLAGNFDELIAALLSFK